MGVKYVKDFEFPAQAGFHSSNMPARAGMSAKGMPSRAKPNAPARGAARMESGPKMGKGQGYADGGRVKIQGRNQAEIKAAMAKAAAQRKAAAAAKKAQPKSMSKQAGPVMAPTSIVSGRSVSKDYDSSMAPTKIEIPIPAPKKSSYGKYGMQEYAKGGSVKKLARGGTPVPGSKASLGRMPGSKDYYQISNPLSRVGIGSRVVNIPKQTNEQRQRLEAVHKGSRTNAFTGAPNPDYDPAYDPAYEEQFGRIEEFRRDREPMKKASGGKVAKVMREYKAGKLHSGSKKGPMVKNPKQAMAIALSEERRMKKAMGGAVDNYAGKTGPYRGSPKKAKMLGRQDRRAREAMERAEKHAPGRSIDMPDRKAHGGMMRRKVA